MIKDIIYDIIKKDIYDYIYNYKELTTIFPFYQIFGHLIRNKYNTDNWLYSYYKYEYEDDLHIELKYKDKNNIHKLFKDVLNEIDITDEDGAKFILEVI